MQQNNKPRALARPALYIDVWVGETKQIFEVPVARELHTQLGLALATLDAETDDTAEDSTENVDASNDLDSVAEGA